MWTELKYEGDFNWYKKGLDVSAKYNHDHRGEPERYPCRVHSTFDHDDNGRSYDHDFIYLQSVQCKECGHVTKVWPEVEND